MAIAVEMVVPGLIGLWIDRQLGTIMVFLLLGVALGMGLGLFHLVRLAKSLSSVTERNSPPHHHPKSDGTGKGEGR